jgi:hypothetical protein
MSKRTTSTMTTTLELERSAMSADVSSTEIATSPAKPIFIPGA